MKLTAFSNGMVIDVDREKIESFGPHADGGSFIKVNGNIFHVREMVDDILNDRQGT